MELASILEEKYLFYILLLLVVVLLVFVKAKKRQSSSSKWQNLPPGPIKWPIVGNLLNLIGRKPHLIVTKMARVYGPLISLKLGNQQVVIGCSSRAASEILKTHDRELCGRYAPKATPIKESDLKKFSLLWAEDCENQWKSTRVLWKSELFSNKAMELMGGMREHKVAEMVEFLGAKGKGGKVVNIGDVVFTTLLRTLGMLCFSENLISFEDEKIACELKSNIWKFMEHSTTPIIADFFPVFDGKFDPQFQKKRAVNCLKKMLKVWQDIVKERRRDAKNSKQSNKSAADFLDFMLSNHFSDIQIDYMLLEIIPAGLGTLTTTVEWAMAELIKNKEAMKRVREELKVKGVSVSTNSDNLPIKESQVSNLPYLNACIKETLRLHPPIAFLPHCAHETCKIMGYTIPKGCLVLVNVWGLGHDPMIWEDEFAFKPERFLDSNLDFKGQDYEFLPFGGGRRICPGMPFAVKEVNLILASLLSCFLWALPNDADPLLLDMDEKYAVPLRKDKPLLLLPIIQ